MSAAHILVLLLILVGCDRGPNQVTRGTIDLMSYHDKKHGVICYRIKYFDGISCVHGVKHEH